MKSIVFNEMGRQSRLDYFEDFFGKSRLKIQPQVFVASHEEEKISCLINNFSSDAKLVMISLRAPREDESPEEYSKYYLDLVKHHKHFSSVAFVLSAEDVDFLEIFK